jgi:hypothetical protein
LVELVRPFGFVSTPQGIDPVQTGDPAPVAEVFGEQNGAAAADGGCGDQGIEPAELLPDRQLVGIKNQVGDRP